MSEERKEKRGQHWLPASYLQLFAIDPREQKRTGDLYRVDKSGYRSVKVETQGVGRDHYRTANTHQSETLFNVMEKDYPTLIRKVVDEQPLSIQEQCNILLSIVALYCRNSFITNQMPVFMRYAIVGFLVKICNLFKSSYTSRLIKLFSLVRYMKTTYVF